MAKTKIFSYYKYKLANVYRKLTRPFFQFEIELDNISNIFSCSFSRKGWHPIVETLKEYDQNAHIDVRDTTLWKYHKNFCPTGIESFFKLDEFKLPLFVYPWGTFSNGDISTNKVSLSSRFCGPSSDDFIKQEFKRIIDLYQKLQKTGYKPTKFPNSFISGTILERRDGSKKLIVMQGNHRSAIFAHLGKKNIKFRLGSDALKYVREIESKSWPLVNKKLCSNYNALKIFNYFYNENGNHIKSLIEKNDSKE
tara:strand:+ start:5108 stop:5863 length:756 start_codon:yes stop_codon:yes gene_type:complete